MSAYSQQNTNIRKTWFLLFAFIGMVSLLCYLVSLYVGNYSIAVLGFALSIGQSALGYYAGDKIALSTVQAKEVTYQQAPQIHEIVTNLSKIAQIPTPRIYISPDKSANAFATGRDPAHASVCLNQGIIDLLDKNELEGVIAHELSHIKNRDILVMTMTMVLSSVISFITDIGFRMTFFGFNRSSDSDNNPTSPLILVAYIVLMVTAPIISLLISMSVSREREFLADATAVTFTRYPEGLSNALTKLYKNPTPTDHYATSMNHFYIAPPKKSFGEKFQHYFSTHPRIEERIQALRKM